jgi:hypothetical protein
MRRTTLRRFAAAAAVPTLLAAGLTACGSDSGSGGDDASDDTAAASAEYTEGEEVDKEEFLSDFREGLEASTTAGITMTMDLGQSGTMTAEGDADYTTDPPNLAMTMEVPTMPDGGVDIRIVDGVMYMNMGQMTNDKYMLLDLSDPSNLPPGMDSLTEQMDPLAAFEQFGPALTSVTYVGEEEVDGDQTQHFELVMNTADVETFKDLPQGADIPEELTYDAWFDDEFRFRQLQLEMEAAGTPVKMEMQASDWGEDVEIEAPDPDDVVEMPAGSLR